MTSPNCLVNGSSTINGVDVAASTPYTIALADVAGVKTWSLQCIGTDELLSATTITGGLSINFTTFTATATSPEIGSALIFRSVVNGGRNTNGQDDPLLTTTFGVYVQSVAETRVGALNETLEGSAAFGWTTKFNAIVRKAIGSGNVVQTIYSNMPVSSGTDYTSDGGGAYGIIWHGAITIGGSGSNKIRARAQVSGYTDSKNFGGTVQLWNDTASVNMVERPFPCSTNANSDTGSTIPIEAISAGLAPGTYTIQVRGKIVASGAGNGVFFHVAPNNNGVDRAGGTLVLEEIVG